MKRLKKYQLVYVIWRDACTFDPWDDLSNHAKLEPPYVHSVGFVIEDIKEKLVIMLTIDPENQTGFGSLAIPKPWIFKIHKMPTPKE